MHRKTASQKARYALVMFFAAVASSAAAETPPPADPIQCAVDLRAAHPEIAALILPGAPAEETQRRAPQGALTAHSKSGARIETASTARLGPTQTGDGRRAALRRAFATLEAERPASCDPRFLRALKRGFLK
ncbi:MAG: hypothetical protein MRY74_03925 [Neomegalonema sp.]|nr:hypothetical protein [Neomegalonema sp.]